MDAAWSPGEDPVVGIVDGESASGTVGGGHEDAIESVLTAHDATPVRGALETVLEASPSLFVVAGGPALSAVARAGPDGPVLPVGDVAGLDAVPREDVPAALEAVLEGGADVTRRSILAVEVDAGDDGADVGSSGRALFDVTLVTAEPARISEYGVASRGDAIASVRADGVVVATPAGSYGYAGALEAPRLSTAVDAVVVAPIAPFTTRARQWVVPDDGIALTIERDEGDVTVVADDRPIGTVAVDDRVSVGVTDTLRTLVVGDG